MKKNATTRRHFLGQIAAAISLPLFVQSKAFGANNRINMGFIGMGNQGRRSSCGSSWLAASLSHLVFYSSSQEVLHML
jgi:hypothetical protein